MIFAFFLYFHRPHFSEIVIDFDEFENRRTFKEREAIEYSPECNEGEFNVLAETESESKNQISSAGCGKFP